MNQHRPAALNIIIQYSLPIIISIFVLSFAFAGDIATSVLQFEREGILHGEIWRLITGNFVHLSGSHALLNIAGLVLIWLLFGHCYNNTTWIIVLLSSLLTTTLGLLVFNPELDWYVGLSGSLHGLFIAGCIAEIKEQKSITGALLLIIIVLKIIWEQYQGPLPGTAAAAGGNVIVDAHLYGAVAGIAALFVKNTMNIYKLRKREGNTEKP